MWSSYWGKKWVDLNLEWKVSGGFTSSNRENVSRNMSETGTSRNCAKSSKSSFCPSSFLARFPYSCRTFSVFLGLSLEQRGHRSHENDYVQNSLRTKFSFSRAWTRHWSGPLMLIFRWLKGLQLPLRTPTGSSLPQQWGPRLQLSSHLCSSPVELPGVRGGRRCRRLAVKRRPRCLPSVLRKREGLSDSPQPPDQLGVLQQAGVDWQPQLALRHGQLAVFEWVIRDGHPQRSEEETADQPGRTDTRPIPSESSVLFAGIFHSLETVLSHDAPHVDGEESGVPLLLLRGCVDGKELQTVKIESI